MDQKIMEVFDINKNNRLNRTYKKSDGTIKIW